LNDDVLQNAEEAVLTNPASADVPPTLEPLAPLEPVPPAEGSMTERASAALSRYQESAISYVSRKPLQAGLLAAVAGGLLTAVLRSALSRRKPRAS
jgi:hypothetical protein